MSLQPRLVSEIPEETQCVAKAAFRQGNRAMQMRDELGTLFTDEQFVDLFPKVGRPAETPWRLALVTVLQFAENLTDRQAADAVRGRIDWKYALSLELTDAGFDFSVTKRHLLSWSTFLRSLSYGSSGCKTSTKRMVTFVYGRRRTNHRRRNALLLPTM